MGAISLMRRSTRVIEKSRIRTTEISGNARPFYSMFGIRNKDINVKLLSLSEPPIEALSNLIYVHYVGSRAEKLDS